MQDLRVNRNRLGWVAVWLLWLAMAVNAEAKLVVVASIKPIHALVAGVMQGVGEPLLLIPGGASPHDYNLKPSDTRTLAEAQVVFWIGPELERFLVKPLHNATGKAQSVALLDTPGLMLLPLREGGAWEPHQHRPNEPHAQNQDQDADHDTTEQHGADAHQHEHAADQDLHIWLDPVYAVALTKRIVTVLGEADPQHRSDYERNGAALVARLERLHQKLTTELAPVREPPYIVFHDAYQYFEKRYGLNAVGSVVLDPAQRPGARRVTEIRARIQEQGARCVFSEPQFQPALVETVIADSKARRGVLDPLGAALPAGPNLYFELLQGLADGLRACLIPAGRP